MASTFTRPGARPQFGTIVTPEWRASSCIWSCARTTSLFPPRSHIDTPRSIAARVTCVVHRIGNGADDDRTVTHCGTEFLTVVDIQPHGSDVRSDRARGVFGRLRIDIGQKDGRLGLMGRKIKRRGTSHHPCAQNKILHRPFLYVTSKSHPFHGTRTGDQVRPSESPPHHRTGETPAR